MVPVIYAPEAHRQASVACRADALEAAAIRASGTNYAPL
jgi:hypothetical protein